MFRRASEIVATRKTKALFAAAALWALQFGAITYAIADDAAAGVDAGQQTAVACVGDCNGDGKVSIDEILHGVCFLRGLCLELEGSGLCSALDPYGTGRLQVDVLLVAINNALVGCPQTRVSFDRPRQ